jgi:hypothetical protein
MRSAEYWVTDEAPNLIPEYDNVLLGQGCRTPHGAGIDGYGAMVELWLAGGEREKIRENFPQYHFACHESHLKLSGTSSGLYGEIPNVHLPELKHPTKHRKNLTFLINYFD